MAFMGGGAGKATAAIRGGVSRTLKNAMLFSSTVLSRALSPRRSERPPPPKSGGVSRESFRVQVSCK